MVVNYERFNSFFFFKFKGDYLKFLVVSLGLDKIVDI